MFGCTISNFTLYSCCLHNTCLVLLYLFIQYQFEIVQFSWSCYNTVFLLLFTPTFSQATAKESHSPSAASTSSSTKKASPAPANQDMFSSGSAVTMFLMILLAMFAVHCTWVTSNAYSSPSVVLASSNSDG